MVKAGMFIVLDGIDGSGKSTQAMLLKKFLEDQGRKVFVSHEPSNRTRTGKMIKRLVKSKEGESFTKERWVFLFSKGMKENNILIKKELNKGCIVISDRYYYSTLAYQLERKEWKKYSDKFLKPDLTIILDIPLDVSMKRIEKKNGEQKLKRAVFENKEFLKDVKRKFMTMKNFKELKIVNGNMGRRKVFEKLKKEVEKR
ncbi:MAG: dTMP kinase [Nanoarchaeota archaeon]|nr:dTMP kinase [Nanoarchaeota archaeon]